MPNFEPLESSIPVGPLKIAALEGCRDFASIVDHHIVNYRKTNPSHDYFQRCFSRHMPDSYLIPCRCRVLEAEGKGEIGASIRGTDLFILVDVCNYF